MFFGKFVLGILRYDKMLLHLNNTSIAVKDGECSQPTIFFFKINLSHYMLLASSIISQTNKCYT